MEPAIRVNEAQLLEFVHEKINPRPCGANHFGQCFLRYLGENLLRRTFLSIASEQQKSASQPFLGGVERADRLDPPRPECSSKACT